MENNLNNEERRPTEEELMDMFKEAQNRTEIESRAARDFLIEEVMKSNIEVRYALEEAERTGRQSTLKVLKEIFLERGFKWKE